MKLLKFIEFILESKSKVLLPVIFSDEFKDKIENIGNSYISSAFKNLYGSDVVKEFTFITLGDKEDTIFYTDSSKVKEYLQKNHTDIDAIDYLKWISKTGKIDKELLKLNKTEIKVGRFVNRFFPNTFTDKAVEDFVNKWKSIAPSNSRFEIFKGVDIKNAYRSNFYHFTDEGGNSLINSCMNDELDLIDFYAYCPSVSCLVLLSDEGYILGRALVWKDHMDRTIMDRVYFVYDKDYHKFLRYAQENGWYYKKRNISGGSTFIKNGEEKHLLTKVRVPNVFKFKDDGFPYMDTFYYAQDEWAQNYEPEGTYLKLQDIQGGYEEYIDEESENENS